jgi:hypothetical protein
MFLPIMWFLRWSASTGCTAIFMSRSWQYAGGLLGYIRRQLGLPIASTAPLGKITDAVSAAMRRFAREQRVPWVEFVKGQGKDELMQDHLARFVEREGVAVHRAGARRRPGCFTPSAAATRTATPTRGSSKTTGVVNQCYVYAVDADFGPLFLKFWKLIHNPGIGFCGRGYAHALDVMIIAM